MKLFSSLRSRIFLASALLAVLSIATALLVVGVRVRREAERALQREIAATGRLVDQLRATRSQTVSTMARLIADIPQLNAAASTNDPQTVQDLAEEYRRLLGSNLLLVTNASGAVLAIAGAPPHAAAAIAGRAGIREALAGREHVALLSQADGILQLVTVPLGTQLLHPELLGTLSVGFLLDEGVAAELKAITGSDVAFAMGGRILATTLPSEREALAGLLRLPHGPRDVRIGSQDYAVLQSPLAAPGEGDPASGGPVALILRSRTEELAGLQAIRAALAATAVLAVALATLLSFAVARTITRPLAAVTDAMREVASTGDLTRKIVMRHRWDDEDARLLMTTFNTLTDSIARFQREMSQKERLSSLGRLSTVIAHEIRNPLMIIKATLHSLRQQAGEAEAVREAAADIDHEVARLNRLVNEVLDFARPLQFALEPADVNAICRESAAAAQAAGSGPAVELRLDASIGPIVTDAERLRGALVNIIVNARHAVAARAEGGPAASGAGSEAGGAPVTVSTEARGGRIAIQVDDRGVGIEPAGLARMFDPYFTTKRGGTGLGLAIAKNIVEGLGGTIAAASTVGEGTSIRIELPAGGAAALRSEAM